ASVTLAGGKAVHYLCDEQSNWYPDITDMRKKITDKTKGIVIINPNNPTGALYPKEILEQIVELAREHELLIFADEIYDRLVMDGKQHISIASLAPDLCVVSFNGLSKSHLIAGYRCGWMCISGDKSRAKGYIEGINLLSSMRLCANVPTQSVIPKALEMLDSTKEMLEPGGRVYEQREYIYNALNDIPGVSAVKPEAAFYIFPKMDMKKFHIKDDEKFALDFLKEKKILVTHGGGFHWNTPDHFRIVYLPDVDTLTEACTRMKDFFAHTGLKRGENMFRKLRAEAERENGKENKLMFDNRALFALLLPIIIEQILNSFMGMVDTVMVSNVGSAAISAVSL
nr:aminotransferase class I/II-fold pyridoxal phosphate-dependent enzyme [Lachnospira sp.]